MDSSNTNRSQSQPPPGEDRASFITLDLSELRQMYTGRALPPIFMHAYYIYHGFNLSSMDGNYLGYPRLDAEQQGGGGKKKKKGCCGPRRRAATAKRGEASFIEGWCVRY
jgi:hypothetical protein